MAAQQLETLEFATPAALEAWLTEHHGDSPGIWLKFRKKAPGVEALSYAEALEVALCHGWIDGQKAALDDRYWLQRFTPRRARSKWSRINRDKAEALIADGRMHPAGLAEVERARADGRWEAAYESSRTAEVPDDLAAALAAEPAAARFFETLDRTNRYAVLYRVQEPKKPETRARRIEKYVAMLAAGEKIHP
ncbi:YdeI/OmpD-associated family protein [Kitasatospora mediocidica]|uniref:YdeI/OmpD-associated family protein n=1 Tax=Kitasatospora mediocidica TaxID=58352 RepID=UPI00056115E2|nr:YdeI/OmpD-associated family protein [Kitasatospora mediocidica]